MPLRNAQPLSRPLVTVLAFTLLHIGFAPVSLAQDGFNPFWKDQFQSKPNAKSKPKHDQEATPQKPYLDPMQTQPRFDSPRGTSGAPRYGQNWQSDRSTGAETRPGYDTRGVGAAPPGELDRSVASDSLAPVTTRDGTALPYDLWQGVTVGDVERLIASLTIPPRSTAVHDLWTRVVTSNAQPPRQGQETVPFSAVQSEALFRSGLLDAAHRVFAQDTTPTSQSALYSVLKARAAIGANAPDDGCPVAKALVRRIAELPDSLRGTASLMIGYCAVHDNNRAAAGLAADLATDNGVGNSAGIAALRAFSVSTKPAVRPDAALTFMDFRIVELAGGAINRGQLASAKPPLLAAVATSQTVPSDVRIAAAELALKLNAISDRDLMDIYRSGQRADGGYAQRVATTGGTNFGDETRRASLFNAAETETSPLRKARNIRSFLDSSRRAGLYWHGLRMMAEPAGRISTLPEVGWFAETAIETSLASGDYINARRWAAFAAAQRQDRGAGLDHWRALIDIADPGPTGGRLGNGLDLIEKAAQRGLFGPVLLHRLATVLDALDTQVPIPLWEMASRTPQPTTGHLPETGVLSALQTAAKNKHYGHMILLTMKTLGPNGAEGAHMIALGDSIRALKRAGLKKEARQLGVEALFGSWPRTISN